MLEGGTLPVVCWGEGGRGEGGGEGCLEGGRGEGGRE